MKKFFPALFVFLIVTALAMPLLTRENPARKDLPESSAGYWVVNTADNKTLTHTSVPLNIGDEYISSENKIYRIVKIAGDKAYVEQIQ